MEREMETRRFKILLIEDDEDDYVVTQDLLEEIDGVAFQLEWVRTYESALTALECNEHDLCLLDYRLGAHNGLELLREAVARGHQAPVIMLTGQDDHDVDLEAMKAGAADFLVKGRFGAPILERSIRYALDRKRYEQQLKAHLKLLGEAHAQLEVRQAQLLQANADLEQFAYVASHDLQEPLRTISSYLHLLAEQYQGKLNAEADDFIQYAVDGAARMKALIAALLAYSRVGRNVTPFVPTDSDAVVKASLTNLQMAVAECGAVVTHDALPTVMADEVQLGQLFQNLIGNAIKFCAKEVPRVHISAQQGGREWVFSIRDNGIGIDPKYAERIFIIFQRLHTQSKYVGTGIGLATCKRIVEGYGGRIWMESEPGQGTTFYFSIPIRAEDARTEEEKLAA